MARKSRIASPETVVAEQLPIYKVALYIRLSVLNGGNRHIDRDSVENQEELLRQFIAGKPQLILSSVYIDNGETGVNFKRSEFERLIGDVQLGKITCIIVKDLSRFGRNYIETGEYLEKIFPFMGVRFIAVNDRYDSDDPYASDTLSMHLKSLANDIYSRDLSRKICPVLRAKQERGEFLGSMAPYGYMRSKADKHRLEIDKETAPIVHQIFQWRMEGMPYLGIAKKLQECGVPSPSQYFYGKKLLKKERFAMTVWSDAVIKGITLNQVYLGHLVQGKTRTALWNGQARTSLPSEAWTVVANTHEPIIEESLFMKVQEINQKSKKAYTAGLRPENTAIFQSQSIENLLTGLVVCGGCGKRMKRQRCITRNKYKEPSVYCSYTCPTHRYHRTGCPATGINEEKLIQMVYELVRLQIDLATDVEKKRKKKSYSDRSLTKKRELEILIEGINLQLQRIRRHTETLYDDYVDCLMSEQDYMYARNRYEERSASLQHQKGELEEQACSLEEQDAEENCWLETYLHFREEHCLTKQMAEQLIEKIVVYSTDSAHIQLRFTDENWGKNAETEDLEVKSYE